MHEILHKLFTQRVADKEEWARCALFFGHDYGWKNYQWASRYVMVHWQETQDDDSLSQLKEQVDQRYKDLLQKREAGFASTGTLLSIEAHLNLFMVAFHEGSTDFRSWVQRGFGAKKQLPSKKLQRASQSDESQVEDTIEVIAQLRQNRTSHDQPINTEAARMRTEQAGAQSLAGV